jgi:hypothetical protein
MMKTAGKPQCSVCGVDDGRALVDVRLRGGSPAILCGTHALMHERSGATARTASELRRKLGDRRDRADRRHEGDELGMRLVTAFNRERRSADRRG